MDEEKQESDLCLIYHNFRGMAQNVRYILYYLQIPFDQVLLGQGQSPLSLKIFQKKNITDEIELPCLIHGDLVIQDCFAIKRHICTMAKRQDLLGQTLQQRALIKQIYYNHTLKKKKSIKYFFKFGQEASKFPQKTEEIRKQAMLHSQKQSGSLLQTVTLRIKNQNQRYLLGHITILDFLFYEESFYQINLFGNLQEKNCKILETINSILGTELSKFKDKTSLFLRIMREFKENFQNEPFYIKNKEKLQSYSIVCPIMSQFSRDSFKRVWLGPSHFIK